MKIKRIRNKFLIQNDHYFKGLEDYEVSWQFFEDGRPKGGKEIRIFSTPPQHYEEFEIKNIDYPDRQELSIIFECRLNQNTNWAKKGHLVAWDQITLQRAKKNTVPLIIGETVKKLMTV